MDRAGPRENRKGRSVSASLVNSVRRFCCKGEQRNGAVLGKEKCSQERSDSTFALIEVILKRVESDQGERGPMAGTTSLGKQSVNINELW